MTSVEEVAAAIDKELASIDDRDVLEAIAKHLVVPPKPLKLGWDYGEAEETYDGWLVFSDLEERVGIAFCDKGFGPHDPWGLISPEEACPSMGMDCGWFSHFVQAYLDSFSATALSIWKVVRWREGENLRVPVTGRLSWDEAWIVVARLREEHAGYLFACEHDISLGPSMSSP